MKLSVVLDLALAAEIDEPRPHAVGRLIREVKQMEREVGYEDVAYQGERYWREQLLSREERLVEEYGDKARWPIALRDLVAYAELLINRMEKP